MRKLLELCVQSNSAGGGYSSSAFCRLAEGIAADCSKGPGGAALLAEALRINTGLVTLDVLAHRPQCSSFRRVFLGHSAPLESLLGSVKVLYREVHFEVGTHTSRGGEAFIGKAVGEHTIVARHHE